MIDKNILEELISQGLSNSQIAERLGVSINRISYLKQKYDLGRHDYFNRTSTITKEEFKSLIDEGYTINDLSKYYGVSLSVIKKMKRNFGLICSGRPIYFDRDWLENKYVHQNISIINIAKECNTAVNTICRAMTKLGILKKSHSYKNKLTKEEAIDLYVNNKMSIKAISKKLNLYDKTVSKLLKQWNIPIRSYSEYVETEEYQSKDLIRKYKELTRDELYDLYIIQQKSSKEISKILNINISSVIKILRRNKIDIRSNEEVRKISSAKAQGIPVSEWKKYKIGDNQKDRKSEEYKKWRNEVFQRDDYTCQACFEKGGSLCAHHIEGFAKNEDLRFDVDNGITLCDKDHNFRYEGSFHNIFGVNNNNELQLRTYVENYDIYKGKSYEAA